MRLWLSDLHERSKRLSLWLAANIIRIVSTLKINGEALLKIQDDGGFLNLLNRRIYNGNLFLPCRAQKR